MTTITKEHAQKIIDAADEVITALAGTNDDSHPDNSEKMCGLWDDLNDRYAPPEVVRELARAMLASMDAEPAGYHVIKECGKIGCSVATLEKAEKTRDFWNKKWTIRPYFYSAAPAPVVPEEMPKGLADQIVSLLAHNIGDKFLAQKIWNACRAAMLQGGFRDLSQPVDPQVAEYEQIMLQDGWVMVPVEPTEEMIAAAMECEDVLFNSDGSFCVQFREIYCAMVDAALALNKGEY
ncbi:hypothetical protein HUL39_001690 [Salmonella enterica]|uniref:DUF551 domain-containing protein n=1 Tax=Salmonella enterica TaxID=28901 RepID=A0A743PUU8_SALER|nr:hypothetical protein [Salmonella enterica]EBX7441931.1 hypothetical protein [Salmonella enterica subsp. enterica serovar Chester]ECA0191330.1 hypothetical protein [Salmonella enterica subsp. enterica serovar Chester]ECA7254616.1 hypothetical protein [Salmonella enterica subsp. enterica serovar Chester]ECA9482520.1 hypothetical protein [Salmonella enterica subsp. enterica serovar Chester]